MQTEAPESAMDRLIRSIEKGKQPPAEHKHPDAERRMNDRRNQSEEGEITSAETGSAHWAIERDPRPASPPPAPNPPEKRLQPPAPQPPKQPAAPPRPEKPAFIYDPKPSELVSGPSFLGLGGDDSADTSYLFEDEPKRSHARAYLLLLFLIAVGVLAALQYRTLKAQGFTLPWSKTSGSQQQQQPAAQSGQAQPQQNPQAQAPMPQSDGGDFPQPQQPNTPNTQTGTQPANNPGGDTNGSAPVKGSGPDMTAAPPATTAPANNGSAPQSDNSDPKASSKPEDKPVPAVGRNKTSASEPASDDEQDQEQSAQQPEQPRKAARVKTSAAAPLSNDPKALWKASSAGNTDASVKLAEMYLNGDKVGRSCDQAVVLLHDAADAGNANAEIKLGALYSSGTCLPLDNVSAYRWFTRALRSQPHNGYLDYSRRMVWGRMNDQERQQVAALNGIPQ